MCFCYKECTNSFSLDTFSSNVPPTVIVFVYKHLSPVLKKSKDKLIMLINITNHLHYTQGLHYIFINTSLQTSLSWSSFSIEFTREVEDEA